MPCVPLSGKKAVSKEGDEHEESEIDILNVNVFPPRGVNVPCVPVRQEEGEEGR